jgi:hypothetical protein
MSVSAATFGRGFQVSDAAIFGRAGTKMRAAIFGRMPQVGEFGTERPEGVDKSC